MKRRRLLVAAASATSLAGCTGGPGDPITMLAVNKHDAAHSVTVWAIRGERLRVANTVEVAAGGTAELGEMDWQRGRYRVAVQVDGDPVLTETFRSADWFNQLDVVVARDGSVTLNRGRAA